MSEKNEQFLEILAQYTKDLSFENINPISKASESENEQPNIDVEIKVDVEKMAQPNMYHVSLKTKINATAKKPLFLLELSYSGDFAIGGFPDNIMEAILYVECPRLLFPFARNIIATSISEGGFPPLYLSPVNFADLYQQQVESREKTEDKSK